MSPKIGMIVTLLIETETSQLLAYLILLLFPGHNYAIFASIGKALDSDIFPKGFDAISLAR